MIAKHLRSFAHAALVVTLTLAAVGLVGAVSSLTNDAAAVQSAVEEGSRPGWPPRPAEVRGLTPEQFAEAYKGKAATAAIRSPMAFLDSPDPEDAPPPPLPDDARLPRRPKNLATLSGANK